MAAALNRGLIDNKEANQMLSGKWFKEPSRFKRWTRRVGNAYDWAKTQESYEPFGKVKSFIDYYRED